VSYQHAFRNSFEKLKDKITDYASIQSSTTLRLKTIRVFYACPLPAFSQLVGRHVSVAIRTITLRIVLCIRLGEAWLHCPRIIRALQIVTRNEGSIVVRYKCACPGATIPSSSRQIADTVPEIVRSLSNVIHSLERKDDCW